MLISWYQKKENRLLLLGACILYVGLISTRSMAVPDTKEYVEFYNQVEAGNIVSFVLFSFEPGFQLLGHLVKLVAGNRPIVFLAIIPIINICLVLLTIQKIANRIIKNVSTNYIAALVLYFAYFGLFYNAIVLRAGIALAILVYSTTILYKSNFKEKDWIKILLLFFIALSFHLSAMIGIIVLLINYKSKRLTEKSYLLIWFSIALIFFSGCSSYVVRGLLNIIYTIFSFLSDSDYKKYEYYLSELNGVVFQIPYKYIFQLFSGLLLLFVKDNIDNIYYKYLNIYLIGLFIGAIFSSIEQISRITDYFLIYLFILQWMFFIRSYSRIKRVKAFIYPISVFLQLIFAFRIINPN